MTKVIPNKTYLATIVQTTYLRGGRLELLALRNEKGLWSVLPQSEFIFLPASNEHIRSGTGMLLIVEVDSNKSVVKSSPAILEILKALSTCSAVIARIDAREASIKEWDRSLRFQAAEMGLREKDFREKEELLRHAQKKLQELMAATQKKSAALDKEREALDGAIRYWQKKMEAD